MFETTSVFDALELDHTQQRVAARSALALAHTRVENHLGAFLSGSVSEEEFDSRLASVQPEMDAYVASACEECGHDQPEHITAALIDTYRVNRRWQPRVAYPDYPAPYGAQPADQPIDPAIAQQQQDPGLQMPGGQPQAPMAPEMQQMQPPIDPMQMQQIPPVDPMQQQAFASEGKQSLPFERRSWAAPMGYETQQVPPEEFGQFGDELGQGLGMAGQQGPPADFWGRRQFMRENPGYQEEQPWVDGQTAEPVQSMPYQGLESAPSFHGAANNPSDQKDDSNKLVKCPECGGSKKTANGEQCPRCDGKGTVHNFGPSMLDNVASVQAPRVRQWRPVVAESGNTDLAGPEPKMDKAEWTRSNPGMPEDESKMHPTKHKDPLVPMPMTNRDQDGHELSEIGEQTTEHKDLPAADGDNSGFSTETPGGKGDHTKTFGDGKHADPVTKATQPE